MAKTLNQRIIDLSKIKDITFFISTFLSKIMPLDGNNQLIIGTTVNILLITTFFF